MASAVTPSKISDYFPPSPKPDEVAEETKEENNLKDSKQPEKGISETYVESKEDPCLSTSSIIITPTSSPAKEEEKKTEEEQCESKETEKESKSRKSLNEVLGKQDPEAKPPVQNKRKGRRKKNKKTKAVSTTDVITSGPCKPKSAKNSTNTETGGKNTLVTDFFPVRRSDRKSKTDIDREKEIDLQEKILNGVVDGLEVTDITNKGRGVVATKDFKRSDFVVEYAGDLISVSEAKVRDEKYSKDPSKGCYMYYFNFKGKNYCIDATEESGKLGRLLNHSKTSSNCHTKLVDVNSKPYLIIVASRDIKSGEELLYDYGDRSKASLESHPWLKS